MEAIDPRNSGTAVYRDIYGGASSAGVTNDSSSSWHTPYQYWCHDGSFDFHKL